MKTIETSKTVVVKLSLILALQTSAKKEIPKQDVSTGQNYGLEGALVLVPALPPTSYVLQAGN